MDCQVIGDLALCVRRACFWVNGTCSAYREATRGPVTGGKEEEDDDNGGGMIIIILIIIVAVLLLVCCCCCCCCLIEGKPKKKLLDEEDEEEEKNNPRDGPAPEEAAEKEKAPDGEEKKKKEQAEEKGKEEKEEEKQDEEEKNEEEQKESIHDAPTELLRSMQEEDDDGDVNRSPLLLWKKMSRRWDSGLCGGGRLEGIVVEGKGQRSVPSWLLEGASLGEDESAGGDDESSVTALSAVEGEVNETFSPSGDSVSLADPDDTVYMELTEDHPHQSMMASGQAPPANLQSPAAGVPTIIPTPVGTGASAIEGGDGLVGRGAAPRASTPVRVAVPLAPSSIWDRPSLVPIVVAGSRFPPGPGPLVPRAQPRRAAKDKVAKYTK